MTFGWSVWNNSWPIPGWFGAEDQGAGIALRDINGSGRPDLIVFHVDNPGGENHGYYRIGWDISQGGLVQTWSAVKAVPGWFGAEDQGAGIALWDISGTSRPDLVVFHVDNPGGENHGFYRIGWDLDTNGDPSSWSAVKAVPGWFGAEDQGADIAIWDINGSGRPDLIVFHLDNPGGENHGFYRIGWDLDTNGDPSSWSAVKAVPGWFGAEDQGAGIAMMALGTNLIVAHIDNPAGGNSGFYRMGALDPNGNAILWTDPLPIPAPGVTPAETQGMGIAVDYVSGGNRPDIIACYLYSPPGENQGIYFMGERLLAWP